MQQKRLRLSALLLLGLGITGIQAQTIYVREKDGTQTAYTLSDIRKLSFSSGNIMVSNTGESTDMYALTDIRYLNFTDLTSGVPLAEQQKRIGKLVIFPNPVNDVLNIQFPTNENQPVVIEIVSIEGRVVYSQELETNIGKYYANVSALPKGLYLCKINDGKTNETTKFLKL